MYDFDISVLMFLMDRGSGSDLLHFFKEFIQKIQIQRRHAETTTDLYRREYVARLAGLREKREAALIDAKKIYDEVYAATDGDENEKWSQAIMEADPNGVDYHFNLEEVTLEMAYKEMADHFNKSSFVIVYALLENELRRLCGLLKIEFAKRLSLQDIESKDYLQSMINYLDKVLEIELDSCLPYLTKIKQVQFLRNKIMHAAGEFPLNDQPLLDQLIKDSKGNLFLQHYEPMSFRLLKIKKIDYVYQQYDLLLDFTHELIWCIDTRMQHALIKEKLLLLFHFLDEQTDVIISQVKTVKKGREICFSVIIAGDTFLDGTLTLQTAKRDSLHIDNRFPVHYLLGRLLAHIDENRQSFFDDFLRPFYKAHHPLMVTLVCNPH